MRAPLLSAQVVLKPQSGPSLADATPTTENIELLLPDIKGAAVARAKFKELGFEVGELVANSFSITATRNTFERVFHTQLHRSENRFTLKDNSLEFPLEKLPENLGQRINAVTFSTPPDFGPNSF
jgi:hypothetical protein